VYSWSTTGDHPRGEAPRAAYFANHLLDVNFEMDDKPKRVKIKPNLVVGEDDVDVIAFEDAEDLEPVEDDLVLDSPEMQRKLLKNPHKDIFEALGLEIDAALRGDAVEQSGLGAFM